MSSTAISLPPVSVQLLTETRQLALIDAIIFVKFFLSTIDYDVGVGRNVEVLQNSGSVVKI